ncbi:MAG: propanediol utilization protein [Bacilli bacterium]|nr:propanediol utilization protein [Bacilli bacterium]
MKVSVGISNHHVHLTRDDCITLFGHDALNVRNMLNQPGQFASLETVDIETPKNKIKNLVIVGPFRDYTQVEVSKTDAWHLGINPPVRDSGDLNGASLITIIGPVGKIEKECAIIANRHIHVDKNILREHNLLNKKVVSIKIIGEKGGILENIHLKESEKAYFELHLDTDDANAFLLENQDEVDILL